MKKLILLLTMLFHFTLVFAVVNINTATEKELQTLPHIGPSKAKAIIEYREENGSFKKIEEITQV